jgi:hypothetical protein
VHFIILEGQWPRAAEIKLILLKQSQRRVCRIGPPQSVQERGVQHLVHEQQTVLFSTGKEVNEKIVEEKKLGKKFVLNFFFAASAGHLTE